MTGIDGNYRMTCESVLEVLRDHRDSVMAVLEAFVYDPLLNWRLMDGMIQHVDMLVHPIHLECCSKLCQNLTHPPSIFMPSQTRLNVKLHLLYHFSYLITSSFTITLSLF